MVIIIICSAIIIGMLMLFLMSVICIFHLMRSFCGLLLYFVVYSGDDQYRLPIFKNDLRTPYGLINYFVYIGNILNLKKSSAC